MGARLNKKEREIFEQVIKEWRQKDKNVSPLRIVFEVRSRYNLRRHTMHQMVAIARRIMK